MQEFSLEQCIWIVSKPMKLHFESIIKNIRIKLFIWSIHFFPGGPLNFETSLLLIWAHHDEKDRFQNYQTIERDFLFLFLRIRPIQVAIWDWWQVGLFIRHKEVKVSMKKFQWWDSTDTLKSPIIIIPSYRK